MKTHIAVAPRVATIEQDEPRHDGRVIHRRRRVIATTAAVGLLLAALGACSPSASSVPSIAVPSVNASAVASAAAGAAVAALDQVDAAITANTSSTGLTADEATSLKDLSAGVRTAITSGDMTAAKTAVDNLSTKVDGFAAKLTGPTGDQLRAALAALKSAIPAS
jgi:hypothetical protein